jgi:thiosulfate/3-mercaptopyruvate sulfurtransferase
MSDIAIDELAARLGAVPLLDVRTAAEFDGSGGSACDPRQGHIPGARNVDVHRMMQMAPAEIHAELAVLPGTEIVTYCHSGSRSAVAAQMLCTLGYDARNYPGSWHEWSRHEDLPVER